MGHRLLQSFLEASCPDANVPVDVRCRKVGIFDDVEELVGAVADTLELGRGDGLGDGQDDQMDGEQDEGGEEGVLQGEHRVERVGGRDGLLSTATVIPPEKRYFA